MTSRGAEGPWPVSICLLHNVPLFQAHHGCDCDVGEYPTMYMRVLEVVPVREGQPQEPSDEAVRQATQFLHEAAEAKVEKLRVALEEIASPTISDPVHREYPAVKRLQAIARKVLASLNENGENE